MSGTDTSANAPLDATAQFLTFDAGMYAVDFHAPLATQTNIGLPLPCARLDVMPQSSELEGRAFVSMMSDGGWLSHGDLPTFVRVVGGKAGVLLTIYKATGGMPAPELRIRYIRNDLDFPAIPGAAAMEDAAQDGTERRAPAEDELPVQVLVHAQKRGDIRGGSGQWAGIPGSRLLLEGFAITCDFDSAVASGELEYQGILGDNWSTPWFAAGEFCGSRGMALPILGLRIRLTGAAAQLYVCRYAGSFVERGEVGPVADGEACEGGGQPMDALYVVIARRHAGPSGEPEQASSLALPDTKPSEAAELRRRKRSQ